MNKVEAGANFFYAHSESIIESCQLHFGVLAFSKEIQVLLLRIINYEKQSFIIKMP